LPNGGVHKVGPSQHVKALEVLGAAEVSKEHRLIDLAEILNVSPQRAEAYLLKEVGEQVEAGEVLAVRRGLRKRRATAPIDGTIVYVGDGQLIIEGARVRQEVYSSIPGRVVEIEPGEYVTVETGGVAVQIAWGHGGAVWGTVRVMDSEPSLTADPARLNIDHRGAIVIIGAPLSEEFLKAAIDIRVKGLLASSMHARLVPLVVEAGFPVGLTQGFGHLPMNTQLLTLFNTYNGHEAAFDMPDPQNWREKRPEIIIPLSSHQNAPEARPSALVLKAGRKVRVLQNPYLGEIGTVTALSDSPHRLGSGLWMPGALVEMPSGETVYVPLTNLELLT
jgi:hypothetical protein